MDGVVKILLNIGAGPPGNPRVAELFPQPAWQEIRVDIDPGVRPDLVAHFAALPIAAEMVDAAWSSHSLEHLYAHEVAPALAEAWRVLKPGGRFMVAVPDLQIVAATIAEGRLDEPLYESPMGPISAGDIVFGHGASIAKGQTYMAHRTGFTPNLLGRLLLEAGFAPVVLSRKEYYELAAVAFKPAASEAGAGGSEATSELPAAVPEAE